MTELLEKAVAAARNLPADAQNAMARLMLSFAEHDSSITQLTAAEEESLAESLAQSARREFASDSEVQAVWAKHGL